MKLISNAVLLATMLSAGEAAAHVKAPLRGARIEDKLALVDEAHESTGAVPTPKPFPKLYNIQPERCASGMWRVGCIIDSQIAEQRWYHEIVPKEDQVPMTPEICFAFCKNSSGASFFGLKRGDECYCTPFFHNTDKGGKGECDMPCVGNQVQMCGGQEMVDVYQMHDCSNLPALPCKHTPAFPEHTKTWKSRYYKKTGTICTNAKNKPLTTIENYCEIECDKGYEQTKNDIRCVEKGDRLSYSWSQIEGSAVCSPVNCGFPAAVPHSTVPRSQVVFPNTAMYSCQLGFTTDQEPQGPKNFTIECLWDAKFSNASECLRVKCGSCPHDSKKYFKATAQEEGMRVYEDLCTYDCAQGYTLNSQAAGKKQYATVCLATGEFSEPQACMPVECGPALQVPNADFEVPKGSTRNTTIVFPEVIDYTCEKGYTHSGKHGGETESTRTCQYTGLFSAATACNPNSCGKPPVVEFSSFIDKEYFFTESVTYSCDRGYTLSGKAGTTDALTMPCNWDGTWDKPPTCKPVECGVVPDPSNNALQGHDSHPQMWKFAEPVLNFTCNPGYSTDANDDPWNRVSIEQATFCQANGNFAEMLACVNINDCKRHDCSTPPFGVMNGKCVDVKSPIGDVFEDYTCDCDAGYEITLHNDTNHPQAEKRCTNINDCPAGCAKTSKEGCCGGINAVGFPRGMCQDGLIAYECNCGSGYELGSLEGSAGKNATCTPVVCGAAPKNTFSSHDAPSKTTYDTPQWTYTCDEGYTLEGIAGGTPGFSARCQSTGSFSPLEECKPVTCGEVPRDYHADKEPKSWEAFFPMKFTYTCDEGYSYNSQFGGPTTTKIECQSNGKLTDLDNCKPVECGLIPNHKHASWTKVIKSEGKDDTPAIFVFGESPVITCDAGYSLDQTTSDLMKSYKLSCLSNGEWEPTRECKPVLCGPPADIANTKVSDASRVFLESSTYKLDEGYTLDAKPDGRKEFTVTCTETAQFSQAETVFPVDCHDAPEMANTTYPGTKHVFPTKAKYSCLTGFSTSGEFGGPTTYEKQCMPDSSYDGSDECKPVACGKVSAPNNTKQIDNSKGLLLEELVYGQTGKFECDPGWAVDAKVNSNSTKVVAYCQANGTILYPEAVLNIADCASPENQCVSSRKGDASFCVDNPEPTGVHMDDFHCACSSGFREDKKTEGVKSRFCFNVNDVPVGPKLTDTPVEWITVGGDMNGNEFSANKTGKTNIWDSHIQLPGVFSISIEVGARKEVKFGLTTNQDADHGFGGGWGVDFGKTGDIKIDGKKLGKKYDKNDAFKMEVVGGTGHVVFWMNGAVEHTWTNAPREVIHSYAKIFIKGETNEETPVKVLDIYRPGCFPGSSEDLVNDYVCACPAGFHAGHRCQPQTCGKPLEIPYAHTPSDLKVDIVGEVNRSSEEMSYKCDLGYTLDGGAEGARDFITTCQNNGTITGEPICHPVRCNGSPARENAAYPKEDFVFPQTVDYMCNTGYSYDAKYQKDDKNKKMQTECQSDGKYKDFDTCKAIKCPDIASQKNVAVDLGGIKMKFPEKHTLTCDAGYSLDKMKHGDITYDISCDAEGLLQSTSGKTEGDNCIPIDCGDFPVVPDAVITGSKRFEGVAKVQCDTGYSTDQTPVATSNNYEIRCQTDGSYSAHPDCLRISSGIPPVVDNATASSTEEQFYEDEVTYTLQTGFTLNGKADGMKSFKITAQADGEFTATKVPLPVECGTAPDRQHASHPTKKRVFPQTEPYTCLSGFTLDGNANGVNSFELSCEPDGKYKGDFACQRVMCGDPTTPANSERKDSGDKVFEEKAAFKCLPGYTLDGTMAGNLKYKRTCQADGTYSAHPGCVNADDCEGHSCSPNGKCEDNKTPTGVHKDDYVCICDDGFEEKIEDDGTRTCFNIPDCPEGACLPGECHDLVNDYKCDCPAGYFEDANKDKDIPHDCLGVSCGPTPKYDFASTEWTKASSWPKDANHRFDLAPLEYECKSGYSLQPELPALKGNKAQTCPVGYAYYQSDKCLGDSPASATCCLPIASGPYEFTVACQANKTHEAQPDCKAVPGGYPTPVNHASAPEKMFFFPEDIPYECDEGHSVDGTAAGAKSFSGKVEADGTQSGILSCSPIACPTPTEPDTFGPFASYNSAAAAALVYEDEFTVTCNAGHALDKNKHGETSYTISCMADGTLKFSDKRECTPIECVDHKEIGNSDVKGSRIFGEKLTATAKEGYSLDGTTADTSKTFDFYCQADGSYSHIYDEFIKIVCGFPTVPAFTKILNHKDSYDAFDKVEFELDLGYTEDATADGKKSFKIECKPDGDFTKLMDVKPVMCGTPADKKNAVKSVDEDLTFSEKVTYNCDVGYTLDASADGTATYEESCASDGKFADSGNVCKPVDCGMVTTPDNSELEEGDSKLVFPQTATFKCKPGYSGDRLLSSELTTVVVSCKPDSKFLVVGSCQNNDDCSSPENGCNSNGACVDAELPTGKHDDDFSCKCESGFKEEVSEEGQKQCININDCPQGACEPGSCVDEVNGYHCECPVGYHQDANAAEKLAADCFPNVCGKPEAVENATTDREHDEVKYDEPTVTYTCAEGHSIDGTTNENMYSFSVDCKADKSFEKATACMPIVCPPPALGKATWDKTEYVYQEVATAIMEPGYYVGGNAAGSKAVKYVCQADSSLMQVASEASIKAVSGAFDCAAPEIRWRKDLRCGHQDHLGPHGGPAECNPAGEFPCCSPLGWCGNTADHCACSDCKDYRGVKDPKAKPGGCSAKDNAWDKVTGVDSGFSGLPESMEKIAYFKAPEGLSGTNYSIEIELDPKQTDTPDATPVLRAVVAVPDVPGAYDTSNFTMGAGAGVILPSLGWTKDDKVLATADYNFTMWKKYFSGDETKVTIAGLNGPLTGGIFTSRVANGSIGWEKAICPLPRPYSALGPDASYDRVQATQMRAGDKLTVTCNLGFSLDKDDKSKTTYEVECNDDGKYEIPTKLCEALDCGEDTKVCYANVAGSTKFGGKLEYQAHPGFSLDGTPAIDAKSFNVYCQADGSFTEFPTFVPISAGPSPDIANAVAEFIEGDRTCKDDVVRSVNQPLDTTEPPPLKFLQSSPLAPLTWWSGADEEKASQNPLADAGMDLGEPCTADAFRYDTNQSNPAKFELQASADGQAWHDVLPTVTVTEHMVNEDGFVESSFAATNARYWRMKIVQAESAATTTAPPSAVEPIRLWQMKMACGQAPASFVAEKVVTKNIVKGGESHGRRLNVHKVASAAPVMMAHHSDPAPLSLVSETKDLASVTGTLMKRSQEVLFKDQVKYTCDTGYFAALSNSAVVYATDPTSFIVEGDYQGELEFKDPTKMAAMMCRPVTCEVNMPTDPKAPAVPVIEKGDYAAISYTEKHTFSCVAGYSLDGTPGGAKDFQEVCGADGLLTSDNTPKKIDWCLISKCNLVDTSATCENGDLGYSCKCSLGHVTDTLDGSKETCVEVNECDTWNGNEACGGTAGVCGTCSNELANYTCACNEGYENKLTTEGNDGCTPVRCPTLPQRPKADSPEEGAKLTYTQTALYSCKDGYTLDATASGTSEFTVECLASASLSAFSECAPVDGGQLQEVEHSTVGTAFAVSLEGMTAVSTNSKCIEAIPLPEVETPVFCDKDWKVKSFGDFKSGDMYYIRPAWQDNKRPNAILWTISSPVNVTIYLNVIDEEEEWMSEWKKVDMAGITYQRGNGQSYGPGIVISKDFGAGSISINGGKTPNHNTFVAFAEPIPSPGQSYDPDAGQSAVKVELPNIYYGQVAVYTCDPGYTTTGTASGPTSFKVTSSTAGTQSDYEQCLPVACGVPPAIQYSLGRSEPAFFGDQLLYTCKDGYSINANVTGNITFTVDCTADGEFVGEKACMPISCGKPEHVKNSQMSEAPLVYNEQLEVICESGYTVDRDPDGESTFIAKCQADATYTGMQKCQKITCGPPPPTDVSASTDGEKRLAEEATWKCKDGYSMDGLKQGPKEYTRQCMASGSYGVITPNPNGCVDINACEANPCGANGACTDAGPGVTANGGYSCACSDGYEVKLRDDGTEKCSADDCAGAPCGDGGTCTDLSKVGGAPGQYSCECELGYAIDETDPEKPTCKRQVCPPLPSNLANVKKDASNNTVIDVATWKVGDTPEINVMFSTPILKSYDVATFTCAEGYSTDGGVALGTRSFTVSCEPTGALNRMLFPYAECQPIRCDNWQRPMIAGAVVMNSKEDFYEYGDVLEFKCQAGATTTGYVGDIDTFDVPCQADGLFPDEHPSCTPIECMTMSHDGSNPSHTGNVTFDTVVTYTCLNGYQLAGAGPTSYSGTCGADGIVAVSETRRCQPVVCGPLPAKPMTTLMVEQSLLGNLALLQDGEAHLDENGHLLRRAGGRSSAPFRDIRKDPERPLAICSGDCDKDSHCEGDSYCFKRNGNTPVPGCSGDSTSSWDYCVAANTGPKEAKAIYANVGGNFVKRADYAELPGPANTNCVGTSCDGFVEFAVECDQDTTVKFQLEYMSEDSKSNSIYIQPGTDDKKVFSLASPYNRWNLDISPSVSLAAGTTNVRFVGREDGLKVRKVMIDTGKTFCAFKPPPTLAPAPAGSVANYMSPVIIAQCQGGSTVNGIAGGVKAFAFACQADGTYSSPPVVCETVKFDVQGSIADAANPADKVVGAQVQILKDGAAVDTVTASGGGLFSARVPPGVYVIEATMNGYITAKKNITLTGTSTGNNLLMSKELEEGEWRFVVSWLGNPSDMDTHVTFGPSGAKHLYYGMKSGCDSTTGICATIDIDDVSGWGPETVTVQNAKNCQHGAACLIKYILHNYAYWNGDMGDSASVVTVYTGNRVVKKYTIPKMVGDAHWYRVFTLDTRDGQLYDGDVEAGGDFLAEETAQSWAASFNYAHFEKVPSWGVIKSLSAASLGGLHQLNGVTYMQMSKSGNWDCEETSWETTMASKEGGWNSCPAGKFLAGLRRTGSRDDDVVRADQISHGWCCKSSVGPADWGTCEETSILQMPGQSECPDIDGKKAALVALHKKAEAFETVPMPKPMKTVGMDFFNLEYRKGEHSDMCVITNGGSDTPNQNDELVVHKGCDTNRRGNMVRMLPLKDGWFRMQSWSGMCLIPHGGEAMPNKDTKLVWGNGCSENRKELMFREVAVDNTYFILQHYSGFCVAPDEVNKAKNNNRIRLKFCDSKNNRMQWKRVQGHNGGGIVMSGSMVRMKDMYQHAWLDVWGCGCEGNRYCVYTHFDGNRENGQSGKWKIEKRSTGRSAISHGDVVSLQNQYGHKSYLDTRAGGCEGDRWCVSTSDAENRDQGTGRWEVVRYVGAGHLRDGDWVSLKNQYGSGSWLNTRGHMRRRVANDGRPNQEVSTADSQYRDGWSGTWALYVEEHAGTPPAQLDVATDGTMVDAIHGSLHKFKVENYYVKLAGPSGTGCRGEMGADPGCEGHIQFYVECSAATPLSFKAEVIAPDGETDSFFVAVNGVRGDAWHTGQGKYWSVSNESPAASVEAGVHEVKFEGREDGIKVRNFKIVGGADKCKFVQKSSGKRIESGQITVTSGRTFFPFQMKFGNPKVFIMTSKQGGDPAKIRIADVSSKGFSAVVVEPSGSDGPHIPMEKITYLVAETGVYELTDGRKLEVGSIMTSKQVRKEARCGLTAVDDWESIDLGAAFEKKPAVIHSLQTMNNMDISAGVESDPGFFSSVVKDVEVNKFKLSIDRTVIKDQQDLSEPEEIAYFAIEQGSGSITARDGTWIKYAVSMSDAVVTGWGDSSKADIKYFKEGSETASVGSNNPLVLTSKVSRNGGDGGWTRILSTDKNSAKVVIDEPKDCRTDRKHPSAEKVAILAFEKAFSSIIALPELNKGKCCTQVSGGVQPSGLPRYY